MRKEVYIKSAGILYALALLPTGSARGDSTSARLYPVIQDNRFGYIDKAGKTVVEAQFVHAWICSEGLAAVKSGDKWGFVDGSGYDGWGKQTDHRSQA